LAKASEVTEREEIAPKKSKAQIHKTGMTLILSI